MRQTTHNCRLALLCAAVLLAGAPALCRAETMEIGGIVLQEGPMDRTRVTTSEWVWSGGAEKYPVVSVQMASGRTTYEIRHDRKYSDGAIGLSQPTRCNWYESGMLDLALNGKRVDLLPGAGETLDVSSGKRGRAVFRWENELARVTYTFVLHAKDDKLLLDVALEPKGDLKSVEVRLTNYPGGFNRAPRHLFHTPARQLDAAGWAELDPARENWLFLSDDALDPMTHPGAAGPSAFAFDNEEVLSTRVSLNGYGSQVQMRFKPTARRLRFCFWELAKMTNAQGLARVQASAANALELLKAPETWQ